MQPLSYNHNFIKHIFTKAFSTLNCIVITGAQRGMRGVVKEGRGKHSTSAHLVVASQGERITITNMLAWSRCRSLAWLTVLREREEASERDREANKEGE